MNENVKNKFNIMKFELIDNIHQDKFNESTTLIKRFIDDDDLTMTMETYFQFCKEFALALGYCEATVEEWFGDC